MRLTNFMKTNFIMATVFTVVAIVVSGCSKDVAIEPTAPIKAEIRYSPRVEGEELYINDTIRYTLKVEGVDWGKVGLRRVDGDSRYTIKGIDKGTTVREDEIMWFDDQGDGVTLLVHAKVVGDLSINCLVYREGSDKGKVVRSEFVPVLASPNYTIDFSGVDKQMVRHKRNQILARVENKCESDRYKIRRLFADSLGTLTINGVELQEFKEVPIIVGQPEMMVVQGAPVEIDFSHSDIRFTPLVHGVRELVFEVENKYGRKETIKMGVDIRIPSFEGKLQIPTTPLCVAQTDKFNMRVIPEWSDDAITTVAQIEKGSGYLTRWNGRHIRWGESFASLGNTDLAFTPDVDGECVIKFTITTSLGSQKTVRYTRTADESSVKLAASTSGYTLKCFGERDVTLTTSGTEGAVKVMVNVTKIDFPMQIATKWDGTPVSTAPSAREVLTAKVGGRDVELAKWYDFPQGGNISLRADMCYDHRVMVQVKDSRGTVSQPEYIDVKVTPADAKYYVNGDGGGSLTVGLDSKHTMYRVSKRVNVAYISMLLVPLHEHKNKLTGLWMTYTTEVGDAIDMANLWQGPMGDSPNLEEDKWAFVPCDSDGYGAAFGIHHGWDVMDNYILTQPEKTYVIYHFRDNYGWTHDYKVWIRNVPGYEDRPDWGDKIR